MANTPDDEAQGISRALVINPYFAVSLDYGLFGAHEPSVSEEQWIDANRKLLTKLGDERYLRLLLDVLKGADPATTHQVELADMVEMHFGLQSRDN